MRVRTVVCCVLAALLALPADGLRAAEEPRRLPWRSSAPEAPARPAPDADETGVGRIRQRTAEPASDAVHARFMAALEAAPSRHPALFVEGILVGPEGMTLYTYGRDSPGASTCYGVCVRLWPVLAARFDDEPVGDFAIIERLDGGLQWTWRDEPLYYWAKDTRPGDVTGHEVNDVWFVIEAP